MSEVLSQQTLNRATLARQFLLERQTIDVVEAVSQLLGLQSQIPNPPYIGLWTRLQNFEREQLTQAIEDKKIVRAAMMRSTLHLVTAVDHQQFRPTIQPALERALRSFFGKKLKRLDVPALVAEVRPFLQSPRSKGDLKKYLLQSHPDKDTEAMIYAIRAFLPLVQVPPAGTWGTGTRADYVTAESYLGDLSQTDNLRALFHRYLRAFGPASVMDFQTWVGMTNMKRPLAPIVAELPSYENEAGKVLYDVPDGERPLADTPALVRYLPEYDNILIAHADRTRILPEEHYKKVFLSAARVRSTILVDGMVSGAWKIATKGKIATLTIEPFVPLRSEIRSHLEEEGQKLLTFVDDEAHEYQVEFTEVI